MKRFWNNDVGFCGDPMWNFELGNRRGNRRESLNLRLVCGGAGIRSGGVGASCFDALQFEFSRLFVGRYLVVDGQHPSPSLERDLGRQRMEFESKRRS